MFYYINYKWMKKTLKISAIHCAYKSVLDRYTEKEVLQIDKEIKNLEDKIKNLKKTRKEKMKNYNPEPFFANVFGQL